MDYLNTECSKCGIFDKHIDKILDKDLGLVICPTCAVDLLDSPAWLGKGHPLKCICVECLE